MSLIKSIFKKKEMPIRTYADFWNWFGEHEARFHQVVKFQGDIHKVFFDKLAPKLNELHENIYFLTGMADYQTAELILTADGEIKNIPLVEALVDAAPAISNWKITALKQPSEGNHFGIQMDGYVFDESKMNFYSTEHPNMPDQIDITVTHEDLTEQNSESIINGVFIALDNSLGELNFVTTIDHVSVIHPDKAEGELVPIEKLRDFLIWREKEFVEKYEGVRRNTEQDNYSGLEATLENGKPLLAMVNKDLLNWDRKASHPWIAVIEIKFDETNANGLPDESTYVLLDELENNIMEELRDEDGYLNISRQTADSIREIYFACKEFRKPSKVLHKIKRRYADRVRLDFDIYKDKYWQSLQRFMTP